MINILICDDEKDIVSALKIYLMAENYQIFEAYDGTEALEILDREEIHLVLMDIMMPKMDGITAMVEIRKKSNVPVILLTAKSEDTDKVLGLTIGADDSSYTFDGCCRNDSLTGSVDVKISARFLDQLCRAVTVCNRYNNVIFVCVKSKKIKHVLCRRASAKELDRQGELKRLHNGIHTRCHTGINYRNNKIHYSHPQSSMISSSRAVSTATSARFLRP